MRSPISSTAFFFLILSWKNGKKESKTHKLKGECYSNFTIFKLSNVKKDHNNIFHRSLSETRTSPDNHMGRRHKRPYVTILPWQKATSSSSKAATVYIHQPMHTVYAVSVIFLNVCSGIGGKKRDRPSLTVRRFALNTCSDGRLGVLWPMRKLY